MKKVLFICSGNVARSQIAEAYYNYFYKDSIAISAGVLDFTPAKYGVPVKEVLTVMDEEGISMSTHKVKTLRKSMLDGVEHLYIFCGREECPQYVLHYPAVTFWDVEDPFGTSLENFRHIRDKIKSLILSIRS